MSDRYRGVSLLLVAALLGVACGSGGDGPSAPPSSQNDPEGPPGLQYAKGDCAVGPPLSMTTAVTAGSADDGRAVDPDGVGLIIGHSNAVILGEELVRSSDEFDWVNAARPGKDSRAWAIEGPETWERAVALLDRAGRTTDEVQVVMVHLSRAVPPGREESWEPIEAYVEDMREVLDLIVERFSNARLVYLSSRLTGRFAQAGNREPSAYRHGVANVRLAETYDGPLTLVVGPYLWDDELCLRDDGLAFSESDFRVSDGVHPSDQGKAKFGSVLDEFFSTHPSSHDWYTGRN